MDLCRWLAERRSHPEHLAGFDSSTTLVRALGRYLHGEDFPALGLAPHWVASVLSAGNVLPERARQRLYRFGTASEAVDPDGLAGASLAPVREWVVDQYPERGYPAVLVGSANGAAIHLAALLGIPWLPQTFLVPVRRSLDPDDPTADCQWGREVARPFLAANPDLQLHHMHDPNQDRLPVQRMAYFRVKTLELGDAYRSFLETVLEPGGTVVTVECDFEWPSTRLDDRHLFQFGCIGGLEPEEYHEGSQRVARFLARQGASRQRWDPPAPDGDRTEAEWGFATPLREDIVGFATRRGLETRHLEFDHPRDLSPLVAEVYRTRYAETGDPSGRLIADTFVQLDPWWTLRTGSVPFWLPFSTEPDADALDAYLDSAGPYDEIYLSLFSHGVESVGLASADRWRSVTARAERRGGFLGTDPVEHPMDFGSYVRYNEAYGNEIDHRRALPPPVGLETVGRLVQAVESDAVRWITP